jgi:hypothetical protein
LIVANTQFTRRRNFVAAARKSNEAHSLMSANPPISTPITPFPDPPSRSGEEPGPVTGQPVDSPPPGNIANPSTSSADDLSLLLAQSSPDPYLAEGVETTDPADPGKPIADVDDAESASSLHLLSSSATELDITFSPSPDTQPASQQHLASSPEPAGETQAEEVLHKTSWPLLLVSSYASALTLALGFILWTGRGLSRLDISTSSEPVPVSKSASPSRVASLPGDVLLPLPEPNVTRLGRSLRLGELEVTPRSITRRPVELFRLQGTAEGERESSPVLVMTVELANRSAASTFVPLDPAIVRDPVPAVDQSFIELPGGRLIPMFLLAMESEWSIQDQVFPALQPGESVETILVSEPVEMANLKGSMTWHVKLRTSPFRTDVLGVRFTPDQVLNESE